MSQDLVAHAKNVGLVTLSDMDQYGGIAKEIGAEYNLGSFLQFSGKTGGGSGRFYRTQRGAMDEAWIALVVGRKPRFSGVLFAVSLRIISTIELRLVARCPRP